MKQAIRILLGLTISIATSVTIIDRSSGLSENPTSSRSRNMELSPNRSIQAQPSVSPGDEVAVEISNITPRNVVDFEVSVRNLKDIPVLDGDYVVFGTCNFIVGPKSDKKVSLETVAQLNSETRIVRHDDLFVSRVSSLGANSEKKVLLGRIRLNEILRDFNDSQRSPGTQYLQVFGMVLRTFVITRNGQIVASADQSVELP